MKEHSLHSYFITTNVFHEHLRKYQSDQGDLSRDIFNSLSNIILLFQLIYFFKQCWHIWVSSHIVLLITMCYCEISKQIFSLLTVFLSIPPKNYLDVIWFAKKRNTLSKRILPHWVLAKKIKEKCASLLARGLSTLWW